MVGIQQESPLGFWGRRIEYQIDKDRTVQKIRKNLIKERLKQRNRKQKTNNFTL